MYRYHRPSWEAKLERFPMRIAVQKSLRRSAPDNGDNFQLVALLNLSLGPILPMENLTVILHGN
jgi:hypothetical protein